MKCIDSLKRGLRSMVDDGTGAVSSTRVIMLVTAAEIIGKNVLMNIPVFVHNFTQATQQAAVGFDASDVQLLLYVFAAKVLTSASEWVQQKIGKVG
jgi:hypothetical protein